MLILNSKLLMYNQILLDKVKANIIAENVCPALAKQATQLVFGSGNPDADVVFIGEAPGKNEDLIGEPFVGMAGHLLDDMLQSVHIDRNQIYITNIVKYRPPKNRDPLPQEKAAFWPYLKKQLAIIKPKLVVTLGRHSMAMFVPKGKISELHGTTQEIIIKDTEQSFKCTLLILYHPSAAIYRRSVKTALMQDFSTIPSLLAKLN